MKVCLKLSVQNLNGKVEIFHKLNIYAKFYTVDVWTLWTNIYMTSNAQSTFVVVCFCSCCCRCVYSIVSWIPKHGQWINRKMKFVSIEMYTHARARTHACRSINQRTTTPYPYSVTPQISLFILYKCFTQILTYIYRYTHTCMHVFANDAFDSPYTTTLCSLSLSLVLHHCYYYYQFSLLLSIGM